MDWTHKHIKLSDIRKHNNLYVFLIGDNNASIIPPLSLLVKDSIFEDRIKSYFFKDISKISREEILQLNWNMYITKGYYIKIDASGKTVQYNIDPDKWYISYLEIDGPLGSFSCICQDKLI